MKEKEEVRPGLYRHYKGGDYVVLFVAAHHETREPQVIYVCHKTGGINVRPVRGTKEDPDGWLDEVNLNRGLADIHGSPYEPSWVPRFTYVERVDDTGDAG